MLLNRYQPQNVCGLVLVVIYISTGITVIPQTKLKFFGQIYVLLSLTGLIGYPVLYLLMSRQLFTSSNP
jgi:hypothetical protein